MQNSHRVYSALAGVVVVAVAGLLCWPSSREIRLVSPDGRHTVVISATNTGAKIVVGGPASSDITLQASENSGASIHVAGKGNAAVNGAHVIITQEGTDGQQGKGRTLSAN